MTKTRLTLLPLSLTFAFGLACMGGKEVEGDDAGECNDGADNDLNGVFDCDEETCVGSPLCEDVVRDDTGGGDEVTLVSAMSDCDNGGFFFEVQQTGHGSAPELYIVWGWEDNYSFTEIHPFPATPSDADPNGAWELYVLELETVDGGIRAGETTSFFCEVYAELTFLVFVNDQGGTTVDCGAWGNSPREVNDFFGTDCPTL